MRRSQRICCAAGVLAVTLLAGIASGADGSSAGNLADRLASKPIPGLEAPHLAWHAGGVRVPCRYQLLDGDVTDRGIVVTSRSGESGSVAVRAIALGHGDDSRPLAAGVVRLAADCRRAELLRPELREEVTSGVAGIREDFVVTDAGGGAGELNLDLAIEGAQVVDVAADGGAVSLDLAGGRRLRWSGLAVADALGHRLPSRFVALSHGRVRIAVEDAGAVLPIRIDPTFSDANWEALGGTYPGADSDIRDLVVTASGDIVVCGSFHRIGTIAATGIARWNGTAWTANSWPNDAPVTSLAGVGDEVYASGPIGSSGSQYAVGRWTGSAWTVVGTFDMTVMRLVASGGLVYAGGDFVKVDGVIVNHIAVWNGSSWNALGTGIGAGAAADVDAICVDGASVYAGGIFATAGGVVANNIAVWNGSAWSALGTGVGAGVYVIRKVGGEVYVGGGFATAGGARAFGLARWDGAAWHDGGLDAGSYVLDLAAAPSGLYAAGNLLRGGSPTVHLLSLLAAGGWSDVGSFVGGGVIRVIVAGGTVYALGDYRGTADGPAASIARLSAGRWVPIPATADGFNGPINAIVATADGICVGGSFTHARGVPALNVARWDGTHWSGLGAGLDGSIASLCVGPDGALYAAGYFQHSGASAMTGVARWDGTRWTAMGTGLTLGTAVTVMGGELYAAAELVDAHSALLAYIVRWDGAAWRTLGAGAGAGVDGDVRALCASGGSLYVGGLFANAGGAPARHIARWDGVTWSALGGGVGFGGGSPDARAGVMSIAVDGGDVYVGGVFTEAGGVSSPGIARWDGATWHALGAGTDGPVTALAVDQGAVYAGGSFTTAGGHAASRIARWDGGGWTALGSGIAAVRSPQVQALAVHGGWLYVGGDFVRAAGHDCSGIARASIGDRPPTSIVDVDDAPDAVSANAPVGAAVGVHAHSTDPDAGDAIVYALRDNAGGRVAIDPVSGVVTVATSLAGQAGTSLTITVTASDGDRTVSATFVIAIGAVDTTPPGIATGSLILRGSAPTWAATVTVSGGVGGDVAASLDLATHAWIATIPTPAVVTELSVTARAPGRPAAAVGVTVHPLVVVPSGGG